MTSAARAAASRLNGARSHGPTTPEGKARSAANGTAHGVGAASLTVLPGEDPAEHAAVLAEHLARYVPADAAERFWVEQVVLSCWRLRRLQAVEAMAFAAELGAPRPADARPLPSLSTLARYASRIERDARHAEARLAALVAKRPAAPKSLTGMDVLRLRWLADRMEEKQAAAAAAAAARGEDEPAAPAEPAPAPEAPHTDEPQAPAAPAPNRAMRRRLAALARKAGGGASAAYSFTAPVRLET